MIDKEKFLSLIQENQLVIVTALGIGQYRFFILDYDEIPDKGKAVEDACMEIVTDYDYLFAKIYVKWEEYDSYKEAFLSLVHELAHIHFAKVRDLLWEHYKGTPMWDVVTTLNENHSQAIKRLVEYVFEKPYVSELYNSMKKLDLQEEEDEDSCHG